MIGRSLRLRLFAGAALWISAALVVAGLAIGFIYASNIEQNVHAGLTASLNRLVALLDPLADPPALTAPLPDPRYDSPASGIYWEIQNLSTNAIGRSTSLFDFTLGRSLPAPTDSAAHFVTIAGPDGQSLVALDRIIRFDSGGSFRVIVAENREVLNESIARFGLQLTFALAIVGVALIAAALLQVLLGLGPLDALRSGIEAVRKGEINRLPTNFPSEVQGLVTEVNELLGAQEQSVRFAQARASDLAHGLKTPLAVLGSVANDLRAKGEAATAASIELLNSEMAERVDYQLRLSRLRIRTHAHQIAAPLADAVNRTLDVVRRTPDGERVTLNPSLQALTVDIDPRDLVELAGVLIENAAKWAKGRVDIVAQEASGGAELLVEDDGPGLTPEQIALLGKRGQRLDESVRGTGLGLAIAHEIVALNRGSIVFGRARIGGLAVRVMLPLSAGAPRAI